MPASGVRAQAGRPPRPTSRPHAVPHPPDRAAGNYGPERFGRLAPRSAMHGARTANIALSPIALLRLACTLGCAPPNFLGRVNAVAVGAFLTIRDGYVTCPPDWYDGEPGCGPNESVPEANCEMSGLGPGCVKTLAVLHVTSWWVWLADILGFGHLCCRCGLMGRELRLWRRSGRVPAQIEGGKRLCGPHRSDQRGGAMMFMTRLRL